jgi:hypothetical protein
LGLGLGAVFVVIWHWIGKLIIFLFAMHIYKWVYVWDAVFIAVLLWDGHKYQQRMPPPNPFSRAKNLVSIALTGHALFTPQQAMFSVWEILSVAPRFFFWGIKHLLAVSFPDAVSAANAQRFYDMLGQRQGWIPFAEFCETADSQEAAARALALLVRVGLASARFREDALSFHTNKIEWV